jgi:hypothetical protein
MNPEERKAAIFELMTQGKYSSSGVSSLTPSKIAASYQRLTAENKRAIADLDPKLDEYFEGLTGKLSEKESKASLIKQKEQDYQINEKKLEQIEGYKKTISNLNENEKKAIELFSAEIKKRYGKNEAKESNLGEYVKHFGPLHAAGLATVIN